MAYAKEPKTLQFTTIGLNFFCILLGILCAVSDDNWNNNEIEYKRNITRIELLRNTYRINREFNFEEQIIIEQELYREFNLQIGGIIIYFIVMLISILHLYLCFIVTNLYYRKHFNIVFHAGGALLLFVGAAVYLASFLETNKNYDQHFDIIYENTPYSRRPWNPCKFPHFSIYTMLSTWITMSRPVACQDVWTKFIVIISSFANFFLYIMTSFVIGCFVEEEDGAELLYTEIELIKGGQLPPIDSLPPLPYYCRPIEDSPTSKNREAVKINRVEVPENWTDPKADLSEYYAARNEQRMSKGSNES